MLSPIVGLQRCPHLSALHLCLPFDPPAFHSPLLSQLPFFSSLRTLRLSASYDAHNLLLLLALPLTSLDLQSSTVICHTPPLSPFPPLPPLHTLLFLTDEFEDGDQYTLFSFKWRAALLSSLSSPQAGAEVRLERLLMQTIAPSLLHFIPSLRLLHTMQLRCSCRESEQTCA